MSSTLSSYRYSGYDRMPGVSSQRTSGYSSPSYLSSRASNSVRTSSAQRKPLSSNREADTIRPTSNTRFSRPLPKGPGPLDASGRKLDLGSTNFRSKPTSTNSVLHSGPLKADHDTYSTSYNSSYGTSTTGRVGRAPRGATLNTGVTSGTSSRPPSGSLRGRRSSSLANISDKFSDLKLNGREEEYKSPRPRDRDLNGTLDIGTSLRTPRKTTYDFESNSNSDLWRPNSRSSRTSGIDKQSSVDKIEDSFGLSFNSSTSVEKRMPRDTSLPPMSRKDSSSLDGSKKTLSRQSSLSPVMGTISKYSSGGLVGLRNLGNTCFMNSVLQCLSNTKVLLEYLLNDDYVLDKNTTTSSMKGSLVTAYTNLMKSMWTDKSENYVSPNSFKTQIQRFAPRFMGYAQQDSQEFLRYLLEGLHEDVNKVVSKPKPVSIDDDEFSNDQDKAREYWRVYLTYDNSKIVDIFVGQLKSELKYNCGHRSVTFDPFWDLSVPIPRGRNLDVSINKCIGVFMKEEELDDDERPTCSKCKKRQPCTKSFSIQRFPQILVLHLKRFSQGRYSQKVSTSVDFPQSLDMTEYSAEKGGARIIYNLYGISNHSGGVHSGHYTASCKHPYTSEWHMFNDMRVSSSSASQTPSSEAYLLFYELKSGSSRL